MRDKLCVSERRTKILEFLVKKSNQLDVNWRQNLMFLQIQSTEI